MAQREAFFRMQAAAVVVQAWWRGTRLRLRLNAVQSAAKFADVDDYDYAEVRPVLELRHGVRVFPYYNYFIQYVRSMVQVDVSAFAVDEGRIDSPSHRPNESQLAFYGHQLQNGEPLARPLSTRAPLPPIHVAHPRVRVAWFVHLLPFMCNKHPTSKDPYRCCNACPY